MFLGVDLLRRSAMRNALALSAIFIVVLTICGFWIVAQFRADVREEIDAQLLQAYQELAGAAGADFRLWFDDHDEFLLFTEGYRAADGTVLGAIRTEVFDQPGFQTLLTRDLFQARFFGDFARINADLEAFGGEGSALDVDSWRVFTGPVGSGKIAVFEPISGVEDALELIPRVMLTVGAAFVVTTLIAGAVMAWRQQARLDLVREGIARIGRGDLSRPMAPRHMRDDLDEIMVGIDAAAAELDGSISRLRLFSQNVAHELRTPLARLRAILEDNPGTPDAALERTDDVIRTLDAVQRIARLSHQPNPGALTEVELEKVARLAHDLFAEVAAENGQKLYLELINPATVQGDFQLLAQMLSNLVENAIRHAGVGVEISISIDDTSLSVRDTGRGITGDQDMTEPFVRAHPSRAGKGTGLGLSLVKTIARYHGASFELITDNGLNARVVFPKA